MITIESTLGTMWAKRMRGIEAPMTRAASMNSLFLRESTWPRTTRAMVSQ